MDEIDTLAAVFSGEPECRVGPRNGKAQHFDSPVNGVECDRNPQFQQVIRQGPRTRAHDEWFKIAAVRVSEMRGKQQFSPAQPNVVDHVPDAHRYFFAASLRWEGALSAASFEAIESFAMILIQPASSDMVLNQLSSVVSG
jgi:hypothetical protein